jgi:hypothetical protein
MNFASHPSLSGSVDLQLYLSFWGLSYLIGAGLDIMPGMYIEGGNNGILIVTIYFKYNRGALNTYCATAVRELECSSR